MKEHFLTILRDRSTATAAFRQASRALARLLLAEALDSLPLEPIPVATPLAEAAGSRLAARVVLAPILRAGLAFLDEALELLPASPVAFFGIRRDEAKAKPELYYENLPRFQKGDRVLLLDPMLATGGSAGLAVERLRKEGIHPDRITLVSVIASEQGAARLKKNVPGMRLICTAVDPVLDARQYIVPGLGDFGDRYFGTGC